MDDRLFTDLYQRYKAGSKHVSSWLIESAPNSTNVRAVVMARRNQQNRSEKSVVVLSVRDLEQLAYEIESESLRSGRAPIGLSDTITVLYTVLLERRECALLLRGLKTTLDHDDITHGYLIHVLESIMQVLKRMSPQVPVCSTNRVTGTKSPTKNTFASLGVEDILETTPSEDPIPVETCQHEVFTKAPEIEVELEDVEEEKRIALMCYFQDCANVFAYVKQTWQDFEDGRICVEIAHFVETQANHLLRRIADILIADYPEFADFGNIASFLDLVIEVKDGELIGLVSEPLGINEDFGGFDGTLGTMLCLEAFILLLLLRENTQDVSQGSVDPDAADTECRRHIRAIDAYGDALCQMWRPIDELARAWDYIEGKTLPKDFFFNYYMQSRGVEFRTIDLTLVTSLQMRLAASEIMSRTKKRLLDGLVKTSIQADNSVTAVDNHASGCETLGKLRIFDALNGEATAIQQDIMEATGKHARELNVEMQHGMDDRLVVLFPDLCAAYTGLIAGRLHRSGAALMDVDCILVAVAHLYTALQKCGYLEAAWPDLDFIIAQQGPAALGIRNTEQSENLILDLTKHLGLAMGVGPQQYQAGKISAPELSKIVLPRHENLAKRAKHASAYARRRDATEAACNNSAEFMQGRQAEIIHDLARDLLASCPELLEQCVAEKIRYKQTLTTVEMLSVLGSSCEQDWAALQFDYYQFFVDLSSLIDDIRSRIWSSHPQTRTVEKLATTDDAHIFVHEIFKAAARREHYLTRKTNVHDDLFDYPNVFASCAEAIRAFVAVQGVVPRNQVAVSTSSEVSQNHGQHVRVQKSPESSGLELTFTESKLFLQTPPLGREHEETSRDEYDD